MFTACTRLFKPSGVVRTSPGETSVQDYGNGKPKTRKERVAESRMMPEYCDRVRDLPIEAIMVVAELKPE